MTLENLGIKRSATLRGLGFGLAITKRLVEMHGSAIPAAHFSQSGEHRIISKTLISEELQAS
jgi:signal transduction histidine kinase